VKIGQKDNWELILFKAWKTQLCGSLLGKHETIPTFLRMVFPGTGVNDRKFICIMYFRLPFFKHRHVGIYRTLDHEEVNNNPYPYKY